MQDRGQVLAAILHEQDNRLPMQTGTTRNWSALRQSRAVGSCFTSASSCAHLSKSSFRKSPLRVKLVGSVPRLKCLIKGQERKFKLTHDPALAHIVKNDPLCYPWRMRKRPVLFQ